MSKDYYRNNREGAWISRPEATAETVIGKLQRHRKGFGFVTPLEALENGKDNFGQDIYIKAVDMGPAMHGDIVAVALYPQYGGRSRRDGKVVEVKEHAIKEVVGTFHKSKRFGFVTPLSREIGEDIFILAENFNGAEQGDKVVAEILVYPQPGISAEGTVTEILAKVGERGADIKAIVRSKGINPEFPKEAADLAQKLASEPLPSLDDRRDLRDKHIFTIDGADSKDFDDAVSIEMLSNGNFLLGVHIADVSHYVTERSALDRAAFDRGTSIYLIDQVIPMLPVELSNGICSLNPGEDRLTLSVDMEITPAGEIIDHEIYESVIRSCERLVYDDISDIIEETGEYEQLLNRYAEIKDEILMMAKLADILRHVRDQRGSLDFNVGEAVISLDENGVAESVEPALRRTANRMIEEFMLVANETVAEHFYWLDAPFVYRVHEQPSADKMQEFKQFIRGFGIPLKGNSDSIHPRTLSAILDRVKDTQYETVVGTVMLRSMQKAYYGTSCDGHFGLSLKYYCHFTSPIRRYPDLMIHRIIKEYLHDQPGSERIEKLRRITSQAADNSSRTEREALELEREVDRLKKCEYMHEHIGECFDGVISGVNSFGMFVELPNTIEGMVRLEDLEDDYYDCEPEKYRLIGRSTSRILALGMSVCVSVSSVDIENREIEFELESVEDRTEHKNIGRSKAKAKSRGTSKRGKKSAKQTHSKKRGRKK